jgi:hypothetical protein
MAADRQEIELYIRQPVFNRILDSPSIINKQLYYLQTLRKILMFFNTRFI